MYLQNKNVFRVQELKMTQPCSMPEKQWSDLHRSRINRAQKKLSGSP
jgi:hypothetical protein